MSVVPSVVEPMENANVNGAGLSPMSSGGPEKYSHPALTVCIVPVVYGPASPSSSTARTR